MAWYDVTYSCGHEGEIQLYGKARDREWKLSNEESKLCPDCWKKQREEERQKENAKAAEANQEAGLSKLEGSEKQIPWAESIRKQIIEGVEKQIFGRMDEDRIEENPEVYQDFVKAFNSLKSHSSASWWIDHRDYNSYFSLQRLLKEELEAVKKAEAEPPKAVIEEARAEATVYPEKRVSDNVAEISIKGDMLTVFFPERRDSFREVVKDLGFFWDNGWKRKIVTKNGRIEDRAAQTGNKLLAAGFPVRIYDEDIRQRAISGEYEPECKRWVQLREVDGDYKGWLAVNWKERSDNLYKAARKIAGARWSKGSMMVPPENYTEVLDFAEMYGFGVSEKAQEVINAAREIREKALVTGVKEPKVELPPEPGMMPPVLEVPEGVEILDELRDDN